MTDSNVDLWLKKTKSHQRDALENASSHFDKNDDLIPNPI
jgi:hypothetical protein